MRERRVQLVPLFEDYDPVHSGCVSHSQVLALTAAIISAYYPPPSVPQGAGRVAVVLNVK